MTTTIKSLLKDFRFASDLVVCEKIRYVAAINPEVDRKTFTEAAVKFGFNKHTVGIQFRRSRDFDVAEYGYTLNADGSMVVA